MHVLTRRTVVIWGIVLVAGAVLAAGPRINEFMALNSTSHTNAYGDYSDWIEIYNDSGTSTNLLGWWLTDRAGQTKWQFPSVNIAGGGYLMVYLDNLYDVSYTNGQVYASMGLSGSGEYLALIRPDGSSVQHEYAPQYPVQSPDQSYGIGIIGEERFFVVPTPGMTNSAGYERVATPEFSHMRGFYTNSFALTLTCATASASIRYTLDGSPPTDTLGTLWTGTPIPIDHTEYVRAIAYIDQNYLNSWVETHTYLFVENVVTQSLFQTPPRPEFPPGPTILGDYESTAQVIDYEMDPEVATNTAEMTAALLDIPTLSIVTDIDNLFDPTIGIYVNPVAANAAPDLWERSVSVELLYPDGADGFQEDAGLRIRGNASRNPTNAKHNFRLRFRSEYGASMLDYPIFGPDGPYKSNGVELRAAQTPSWNLGSLGNSVYVRDIWARDVQVAQGQPSTRGDKYHLYLNGAYWGLYETQEKIEQSFLAENQGGKPEDYDIIVKKQNYVVIGSEDAHRALGEIALEGFGGPAGLTNYFRAQGLNADGVTRNPSYTNLLDVDNLMNFVLGHFYQANQDGMNGTWGDNNYYAAFNRVNPDGWKYFMYDTEHILDDGLENQVEQTTPVVAATGWTAQNMHDNLTECPEYLIAFADCTYENYYNGGVLSTEGALALMQRRLDEINLAIRCESARYGDSRSATPATREANWLPAVTTMTNWMATRASVVIGQLRTYGWYPTLEPPVFFIDGSQQHGGVVTNGSQLTMTSSDSIIYTLDGSDPRALGGAVQGLTYSGAIALSNSVLVKARTLDNSGGSNVWSAAHVCVYAYDVATSVRVTELMYNPRKPDPGEMWAGAQASDYEFIELENIGGMTAGLADLVFESGIDFDFRDATELYLPPGQSVVLVNNYTAFTNRYGTGIAIAGEYNGNLNDAGERIRIVDGLGRTNVHFVYSDARTWPLAADGAGHSLVPLVTAEQSDRRLDYAGNWRASAHIDGSPGVADPVPAPGVIINELVAHTDLNDVGYPDYDSNDWLELFNAGSSNISFASFYLSDKADNLDKWALHDGLALAPGAHRVLDEIHDFHNPITNGFGLNKIGESVYLSYLPGVIGEDRVVDCITFKGQENGAAWGRYPDADPYFRTLPATDGVSNERPGLRVLISEIMYNPMTNAMYPTNNVVDEFVEVFNAGPTNVALWTDTGNWRLDGLGYTFPSNTTINSGEAILVVTFDPVTNVAALSAFTNGYGIDPATRIFGPCEGLDNRIEKIGLERPQAPDGAYEPVSWVVMDEVTYFDQAPWDVAADGTGNSLHRKPDGHYSGAGNDPGSWIVDSPSPGLRMRDVVLTQPPADTAVFEPFSLNIGAIPYAPDAVQIEFFVNGGSIGVDSTPPYDMNWGAGVGGGTYSLTAVLTTGEGVSTSLAEQVVVYGNPKNDSWTKRFAVDFVGYDKVEALTNFPALVVLSESITGFLYADVAQVSDGGDLRFGDSAGTTALPYEIEKWDTGGDSYVWVRVPVMSNGASIYAYYGDPANTAPSYRGDGTVWSEDYEGVWHLAPGLGDSVARHDAVNSGSTNVLVGPSAECRSLDGIDNMIVPGIARRWFEGAVLRDMTVTLWARPTAATGNMTAFGSKNEDPSPGGSRKLHIKQTAGGMWEFSIGFLPQATHAVDAGEWQMLTLVAFTNGPQNYFKGIKNGVAAAGSARAGLTKFDYDPVIGHMSGETIPGYFFDGLVEECRVSGVARSDNWVWAVWTNMVPGSEFVSYGTVEDPPLPGPVDADDDGMDDDWEILHFGSTNSVAGAPDKDIDGDGYLNMWEYVAGTDPSARDSYFGLSVLFSNGDWVVCFPTVEAAGTGYPSVDRLYDLESRTNLMLGDWIPIEFYTNLLGDNTEVVHTNASPQRIYYRVRTRLE